MGSSAVLRLSPESLVERFYEPLYRFALVLSGSEAVAADLTLETFQLWRQLGEALREKATVRTWMFRTLYREFMKAQRPDSGFRQSVEGTTKGALQEAQPNIAQDFDASMILEALHRVEECYRVGVTLHYLQELSYLEIAELLELPASSVLFRLARGKEQLRELLADATLQQDSKIVRLPAPKPPWFEPGSRPTQPPNR